VRPAPLAHVTFAITSVTINFDNFRTGMGTARVRDARMQQRSRRARKTSAWRYDERITFRAPLLARCVLTQSRIESLMQQSDVTRAWRVAPHRARDVRTTRVA
jgi:hypothetical protein